MKMLAIATIVLVLSGCKVERDEQTKEFKTVIRDPLSNAINEVQVQSKMLQEKAEIRSQIARQEAWNKELTKVWVRAKDTKTCMKLLKTDTINAEVIDCNKDRFVSVRNDELENFKKEQGL